MGIIGTVLLVATEVAQAESQGGFGLDLNILETNIINLAILIGVLFYFGRKVISNTLNERRSNIETAIREAEERAKEAAIKLSEAQQKLTQAQAEAQQIRKAAEENARSVREAILARAAEDVERMRETAARDLDTERERALAQLRQQVVAMALEKAESELRSGISNEAQQTLIDRSIALLGG
ncbi:MAG: F0F1 ATP synthase subunit B [Fischerella sp.]|nr:F0F1 ATP synthase subunit B [Fischerella sp.]